MFDIYQDIKHIINKQNNILKIRDLDNYIEDLKEKILKIDFGEDKLIKNVKSFLDNYFKNSEEMNNSLTNKSYSDNSIDSLKELEFENEANKKLDSKEGSDNFVINNNAKIINNNDISSLNSTSFNQMNSGNIFKYKKIDSIQQVLIK